MVKHIVYRIEETNHPSIIWVLFDDPRRTEREKYRNLYNANIHREWTPVVDDVKREFIVNCKTYKRIQFPFTPATGKSVMKAEGATVDEVVV